MTEAPNAVARKPVSAALLIACIALLLSIGCCLAVAHMLSGKRYVVGSGLDINDPFDSPVASLRLNQNREPVLTVYGKGAASLTITIPAPDQSHAFRVATDSDGTLSLREAK